MLNRQKVVLGLLSKAGRPLPATHFVKLVFLLRQETPAGGLTSFYDFVPYKYGPFSFTLYRDANNLRRDGYLEPGDGRLALAAANRQRSDEKAGTLPGWVFESIDRIDRQYGRLSQDVLLKDVYSRYPWYATRSELTDLLPPDRPVAPVAAPAVYTIGYQDKTLDGLLDLLLRKGIRCLLDVRAHPVSRRYGFAGKTLSDASRSVGLEYHHAPRLGVPAEMRRDLGDAESYARLFDRYENEILPDRRPDLESLVPALERQPTALLCRESDPACCHRSRLAAAFSAACRLPVIHL